MHCNQEQIEALLDGELVGPEQDAVLTHLRDCPGCRSYYRQLLAMEQALRADTDPVLDDLLPDIMNRVHATPQHRRRSDLRLRRHREAGAFRPGRLRSHRLPGALAQQARQWLSQQGLEPDEDGVYSLTAQQVQDLNAAVPELELPTDDALRLLLED